MSVTETILLGAVGSLIASFIFLFLVLILFKPKIKISPFMCRYKHDEIDKQEFYFIKIVNLSFFGAYDINAELLELDRYPALNGMMNTRYKSLTLVSNKVSHIPGYLPSKLRRDAPYAVRLRTKEDIASILNSEYKSVVIKISLRHGLTGLVKVHSKEYVNPEDIRDRKFNYGLKF